MLAASCGATGKPWGSCSSLQRTPSSPSPLQPFGFSALVDSFRPEGHFLEEALIDDNANLETITKIASSGAQNRRDGFAITTLLEAKRSAAQNGAIQGPLSYLPPPLASGRFGVDAIAIVSAVIHHPSFEQDVTPRHFPPPRGARHIGIRAKERKRTPYAAPLLRLLDITP